MIYKLIGMAVVKLGWMFLRRKASNNRGLLAGVGAAMGLAILAIDFPPVRRFQRRMTVRLGNWLHRRWPRSAARFGYGSPRPGRKA